MWYQMSGLLTARLCWSISSRSVCLEEFDWMRRIGEIILLEKHRFLFDLGEVVWSTGTYFRVELRTTSDRIWLHQAKKKRFRSDLQFFWYDYVQDRITQRKGNKLAQSDPNFVESRLQRICLNDWIKKNSSLIGGGRLVSIRRAKFAITVATVPRGTQYSEIHSF